MLLNRSILIWFMGLGVCFYLTGCAETKTVLQPAQPKYGNQVRMIIDGHLINNTETGSSFVNDLKNTLSMSFDNVIVANNYEEPMDGELVIVPHDVSINAETTDSIGKIVYSEAIIYVKSSYGTGEYFITSKGSRSIYLPAKYIVTWPVNIGIFAVCVGTFPISIPLSRKYCYSLAAEDAFQALPIEFSNQLIQSEEFKQYIQNKGEK